MNVHVVLSKAGVASKNLTSLFWASKENSPDVTDVLEVGDELARLIIRSKKTKSRNQLTLVIVWFSYYAIFIAIAISPPYQSVAPWKYPGLAQTIIALFVLGSLVPHGLDLLVGPKILNCQSSGDNRYPNPRLSSRSYCNSQVRCEIWR